MAFIFDLDGTLLDSIDDLGNNLNTVLQRHGLPTYDRTQYKKFVGNGMKKLVERALPSDYEGFERILEEYLDEYSHHYTEASVPYDKVCETLKTLNQRNIPIAICTNKKQEYTDGIVKHYYGDIDFIATIGDSFDGKHKPNPYYPLTIASKMAIDPSLIYFVGDSDVDMKTAKNAGMIPVGVSWGFRSVEELREHGAQYIIDSIEDVLSLPRLTK
ncbi:HAD-IIIA family hydrolase [Erysipelothrix rhusiopathiae]|uniref:HAD family hydrolase n=1 Tax=Erysipelothrix sp. strain 2 (EsS2-7-Brazil) TaxID=2500579 RepID=UPI00137680CF|nr:HAD family hydrolase [Erysipelothrix sp. strain 2 (EsS2-7-Brazil)]MBK2404208.1 HAD family hydrolase [Erysipelothrix sp. strain 2 (EsS2-7-Brazil)]NBA00992.1 HAD-IIIA family hydrolase [Erysipelothrix rhusiopathiae]